METHIYGPPETDCNNKGRHTTPFFTDFGILVSQAEIGSIVKLQVERGPKHQSMLMRVEVKGTSGPKQPGVKTPSKRPERHSR